MRGDRIVIEDRLCGVHELLPVLHMSRVARERVQQPELGERQTDRLVLQRRIEGYSHEEIAAQLGMSAAAVRMRWSRIVQKLQELSRRDVT